MTEFVRENWKFLLPAMLLHAAIGWMLTVNVDSKSRSVAPSTLAIQARMVDQSAIRRVQDRERQADEQRRAKEREEQEAREREAAGSANVKPPPSDKGGAEVKVRKRPRQATRRAARNQAEQSALPIRNDGTSNKGSTPRRTRCRSSAARSRLEAAIGGRGRPHASRELWIAESIRGAN